MDSLVAIKVRQWRETALEFDTSVLEMMDIDTLEALVRHAAK
jgi:DNA-binding protein YbaB